MIKNWDDLRPLFDNDYDHGWLPDIFVNDLTGKQVHEIYTWVRTQTGIYSDPLAWDRENECDIQLKSMPDPARQFLDGRLESFRHGLELFTFSGVEIPSLTIAVRDESVEFDYRMGAAWGISEVSALFDFLWVIQQMAPNAIITHGCEGVGQGAPEFDTAWNHFKHTKSA
jgi:hypothetical protein